MSRPSRQPLDDTGKPLPDIPYSVIDRNIGKPRSRRTPWPVGIALLLIIALIIGGLIFVVARNFSTVAPRILMIVGVLAACGLVALAVERIFRPGSRGHRPLPPERAYLASRRHCGACGYHLHGLKPDFDGFCTCPECGATWHRDRWTRIDESPDEDVFFFIDRAPYPSATDDRGAILDQRPVWPPRWFAPGTAPPPVIAAVARSRRYRLLRTLVAVPILATVWYLATSRYLGENSPFRGTSNALGTSAASLFGLIALCILYLIVRIEITWPRQRKLLLAADCCPHCGHHPLSATPLGFDRCTKCTKCGSAWRLPTAAATNTPKACS